MHERVLRRLKLSDLRLLRAVVDTGGMAKAAAHLNVSQSAVSKAVTTLENSLGIRLVDRTPKGIAPTPYGEMLLRGAAAIFDELAQSINHIEFLSDPNVGELRFGASEPLLDNFVPAVMDKIIQSYPNIKFHVVQSDTAQHQHLRERSIELVISRIQTAKVDVDIYSEILFDDPFLWLLASIAPGPAGDGSASRIWSTSFGVCRQVTASLVHLSPRASALTGWSCRNMLLVTACKFTKLCSPPDDI